MQQHTLCPFSSNKVYMIMVISSICNWEKFGNITVSSLNGGALLFRLPLRLMLGLWLLMTIIFIDLYASTLTSYLTVTKLKPIPTSLEELTASFDQQTCLLTMQKEHPLVANKFKKVVFYSYAFLLIFIDYCVIWHYYTTGFNKYCLQTNIWVDLSESGIL